MHSKRLTRASYTHILLCGVVNVCAHVLVVNVKCIGIIAFCVRFVIALLNEHAHWFGCGVIHLFVYVQYKERHRFLREQDIWSWHDAHFLPMMTCIHALWCVDMIVGGVCDWAFTAASLRKGGMMTSSCAKLISLTGRQLSTSASNTFLTASKSPVNASASSCMLEGPGVDGGLVWGRRGIASPGSLTIDQETLRSRSAMQKISHRLPCTEYRRKPGGRHYPGLY